MKKRRFGAVIGMGFMLTLGALDASAHGSHVAAAKKQTGGDAIPSTFRIVANLSQIKWLRFLVSSINSQVFDRDVRTISHYDRPLNAVFHFTNISFPSI